MPAKRWRDVLAVVAVVGWVFGVYRDAFAVYFINEDFTWLRLCRFGSPQGVWGLLTHDVMGGIYSWRPLLQLSFAIDAAISGVNPIGYRCDSLAWLGLGACLVYAIGTRVADSCRGLVAAAVFAAHPLLVESVSWTCARGGLMYTTLSLCAVLGYLRWREHNGSVLWVCIPFALALAAQESAVVLPLLVLAADVLLPGPTVAARRRVELYGMLVTLLAGFLWLRQAMSPAAFNLSMVGLDPRLAVTPLGLVVFLAGKARSMAALLLTLEAPPKGMQPPGTVSAALVWALSAGVVLVAVVLWWRGRPLALWGVLWVALAMAPYSLLLFGPFARYMVLPLAGFGFVVAELITAGLRGLAQWSRRAALLCAGCCLVLWLGSMVRQIDVQQAQFVERGNRIRLLLLDLLRELPDPRPGSTLAFYGMEDLRVRHGVFVYGLDDAVRLFYGDDGLRVEFRARNEPPRTAYPLWYHDGRLQRLDRGRSVPSAHGSDG